MVTGGTCSCWPCPSLPHLSSLLLISFPLFLLSLFVKSFVSLDIFFFFDLFSHDLGATPTDIRLKSVMLRIPDRFATFESFLLFFYCLLIERIPVVFRDWRWWHSRLLEDFLAVLAGFGTEALALLLDLQLVFMFLRVYEILFPFKMFRHAFFPRFEPTAHLSRLATHWLRLEGTARRFVNDALFLHIYNLFTRLFGFPKVLLVIASVSSLAGCALSHITSWCFFIFGYFSFKDMLFDYGIIFIPD